ncbi:MAG: hypothetical protein HY876_04475 [Coriobacteriales bacterium]|nr:hypothetical protein [Coriobacteriales bacterium]
MGWALVLGSLAALTALSFTLLNMRVDPRGLSQEQLYRLGASCRLHTMRAQIPDKRPVIIRRPDNPVLVILMQVFLPPPLGFAGTEVRQAEYDPVTGRITILGQFERLQASLPVPWLQPSFRRALRHEYGHAFLDDWLRKEGISWRNGRYEAITTPGARLDPRDFPEELRPVIEEYRGLPRLLYGSPEFTSTFAEYVAESYARYADNERVPPRMEAFLDSNCDM